MFNDPTTDYILHNMIKYDYDKKHYKKYDEQHHIVDISDSDDDWFIEDPNTSNNTNSIDISNDDNYESDDDNADTDIHKRLPHPAVTITIFILYSYIIYVIFNLYH